MDGSGGLIAFCSFFDKVGLVSERNSFTVVSQGAYFLTYDHHISIYSYRYRAARHVVVVVVLAAFFRFYRQVLGPG